MFNDRELSTILAALRHFQELEYQDRYHVRDGVYFEDEAPLDDYEIDKFCEKLNCGEENP